MIIQKNYRIVFILLPVILLSLFVGIAYHNWSDLFYSFNASRALRDVEYQIELGARIPGSQAHAQTIDWITEELTSAGWTVKIQHTDMMGHPIRNIIASWGEGYPWIILGAHYDSRLSADRDPDPQNWSLPVPGANDGASGVATLLELGRILPHHLNPNTMKEVEGVKRIWLVFFDAEDNGKLPGWDWILGSRSFVANLEELPDAAIIIDMIGDADLQIYQEKNSDPVLTEEIWVYAAQMGHAEQFINHTRYRILDDHIPFVEAGVPAVDIIDFNYSFWHTLADTPDKVSGRSMKAVGDTLIAWLTETKAFSKIP